MGNGNALNRAASGCRLAMIAAAVLWLSGCALQGLTPPSTASVLTKSPSSPAAAAVPADAETASQALEMYVYPKGEASSGYQVVIDL